jgi:GAF domain-containing protein
MDGSVGGSREEGLAELGRIPLQQSLTASLSRIAELARQTIPGVDAASVVLVERGRVRSLGLSGWPAAELDERQYGAGFGPCVEAALSGGSVLIADTADEPVHRDFAALARRLGVTSTLSVGLPVDHHVVGSLNAYCTSGRIPPESQELAARFARYAAVAATNAADYRRAVDLATHLRVALQSRAVIEQAKGVLMERYRCTPDDAFQRLVAQSKGENRKLREVAAELVASLHTAPLTEAGQPSG